MAEEFEGRVSFVGVSNNDTVEDGKTYVADLNVPYVMAHAPEVWEAYEVPYQPVTVVIDAEGSITARVTGPVTYQGLKQAIEATH